MILHRVVFQAKFGKADEVVAALKQAMESAEADQFRAFQPRILTDISGPFDTVIMESTHESLASYEQFRTALFAQQAATGTPSRMAELIESGRNEYYTIE
jgi:hypothetical protein